MRTCLAARSTKWLTRVRRQVSLHKSFGWSSWRLRSFLGLHVSQSRSSKNAHWAVRTSAHGSRNETVARAWRGGRAAVVPQGYPPDFLRTHDGWVPLGREPDHRG